MDQVINSVVSTFAQYAGYQSNQPMPLPADPPPPGMPVWVIVLGNILIQHIVDVGGFCKVMRHRLHNRCRLDSLL